MELIKKNIHMDRIKCKASTQITMEDDINITDSRPDVYQLIEEQGEVVIDEIRAVQDHVYVKGKLEFSVCAVRPACRAAFHLMSRFIWRAWLPPTAYP